MSENKTYELKKHWWFLVMPSLISILTLPTIFIPILVMGWALLRWKFDKIEYKNKCLYSRIGILNIDKKAIPLEKISVVSEKTDIIADLMKFGNLVIESSASSSKIVYKNIANIGNFVEFMNNELSNK